MKKEPKAAGVLFRVRTWLVASRLRYFAGAAVVWVLLHVALSAVRGRLDGVAVVTAVVGGIVFGAGTTALGYRQARDRHTSR